MSVSSSRHGFAPPRDTVKDNDASPPEEMLDAASSACTDSDSGEAMSEEEAVRRGLAKERMNRTVSLPECMCIRQPRVVSYAEVGDPDGYVAFLMLGVDSHRFMSLLLDKPAKARGVRLICLDRPGRGRSSDFEDERANRVLEFPEILRLFCRAAGIQSFSLLGQSLGAFYALRCAQEMPDMVATTVYLISPWVPLSVPGSNRALASVEKLPTWLIRGAMTMGTAMPRLLAATGGLSLMTRGCSEEERLQFGSSTTAELLKAVGRTREPSHGVILDCLAALEKNQPLGFDYRDVSMPVHVFHGRADHMVPFAAVQWMSEEMPACTVSVKMGGTHALLMDAGVLDCVLECMCEDFKHFEENAARPVQGMAATGRGPAFSFPAHQQHFKAEGHLRRREGMLIKGWEERYFVLDGFQLHEFDVQGSATARRVVDLRGAVARVPLDGNETRTVNERQRVFPFKLIDPKHRVLYDFGASTTGERAFWVDTLTKASRFSMGSGDEKRQGALKKRFLVTTRRTSAEGLGGGGGVGGLGEGRASSARRQSVPAGSLASLQKQNSSSSVPSENRKLSWSGTSSFLFPPRKASTPDEVASRKGSSTERLGGMSVPKPRGEIASRTGSSRELLGSIPIPKPPGEVASRKGNSGEILGGMAVSKPPVAVRGIAGSGQARDKRLSSRDERPSSGS